MQAASDLIVDGMIYTDFQSLDAEARARLEEYAFIFAIAPAMEAAAASPIADRFVALPHINFPAFHPDLMHGAMHGENNRHIEAPAGNSAIAVACFLRGLTVPQTVAMFRHEIFAELGYLDAWDDARQQLFERCNRTGYAVENDFFRWCAQGCFMYTPNHPRLVCIMDYAVDALRRAGLAAAPCTERVPDNLQNNVVYPVYDEIAACYGIGGSYRFKPGNSNYTIGLADYIDVSFAVYRAVGAAALRLSRSAQSSVDRILALLP